MQIITFYTNWTLIRVLMSWLVDHIINQSNCGMELMDHHI